MATQVEQIRSLEQNGLSRYHVEIDVDSHSAHAVALRLIGTGKRVLELGCASGHMSAILRERGCQVTGVEIEADVARRAAAFCERVVLADLDQLDFERELGLERFDVVVAADVLEHLKDPAAILRSVRNYLRPDGYIVVSIPNVAHLSVRLALLSGRFPYAESGLLDRTHLRFFTRESLERLLDDAGFGIAHFERVEAIPRDPVRFEVPYDPGVVPPPLLEALSRDPEASTYQFVVAAYPLSRAEMAMVHEVTRRLSVELEETRQRTGELEVQVEQLNESHAREAAEAAERSQCMIGQLQLELQEARQSSLEQRAQAQLLSDALEKRAGEAEQRAEALRESSAEAGALRTMAGEQKAEIARLNAKVETLSAREKDLREMLFEAHDQLFRRDEEIAAGLAAAAPAATAASQPISGQFLPYQLLLQRIRELVHNTLPSGGNVLVVSKGDDDLLRLDRCRGLHFPQGPGGVYAGHHPADSAAAIRELDEMRQRGAEFLLIPQTSLWWLDHYKEFAEHVNPFPRIVDQPDACILFDLRANAPRQAPASALATRLRTPFGVNVSGHITSEKGVGEAVRATIRGLQAADIPFVLNDYEDGLSVNLDSEFTEFAAENPYSVNLIQANADSLAGFVQAKTKDYLKDRYNIGYWFWETGTFPREWWDRFEYLDEIWVGTEFVLDAVSRVSPIPVVKIPVTLPDRLQIQPRTRAHFGIPDDAFVFLYVFDYMSIAERKNPLAVIEAFHKAFRPKDKVLLVLKSGHSQYSPKVARKVAAACSGARIQLIDDVLPRADVNSLMHLADCYVSLHRSEGFGLTIAEAMSLEKPVIATAYSGNMDFMTPANSYLVKYKLIEIGRGCEPYVDGLWADPDTEHAAELMRRVFRKHEEAREIGRIARADILRLLNPARAGALMRERLLRLSDLNKIEGPSERLAPPPKRPDDTSYQRLVRAVIDTVDRHVPSGSRVLVVSKGDHALLRFSDAEGRHFPQAKDGVYAGYHPAASDDAIGHLEVLRQKGADYLVFPQTSFWWLDHYAEFASRLEASCRRVWSDHNCIIYKLSGRRSRRK